MMKADEEPVVEGRASHPGNLGWDLRAMPLLCCFPQFPRDGGPVLGRKSTLMGPAARGRRGKGRGARDRGSRGSPGVHSYPFLAPIGAPRLNWMKSDAPMYSQALRQWRKIGHCQCTLQS